MYDLIVVGSGPAGASAARTAARKGLRTLVIEKEKLPRNKLCGGGVTPKVLKLLDFNLPDETIESKVRSARVHVGRRNDEFQTNRTLVYMTSRAKFDSLLTNKAIEAGADVANGVRVRSVVVSDSYVEAQTSKGMFRSKMLIGADGVVGTTAVAGHFYDRWRPHQVAYAIESEVPVGESGVRDFMGDHSYFDLYFGVSPAGYGWVFPKEDHLTVGIGCRLSRLRNARVLFQSFVKRIPFLAGKVVPRPQAHLIPLGGAAIVPSVRPRMLLAGDSAGFAEALLGEGIYFAIWGGQLAAEVAADACEQDRFDEAFLTAYQKRWRRCFGQDFDVAYRVACFSYLEQYDMDRIARFFFGERKVQQCMIGLMEGTLRYRDAKAKLAWPYLKYRLAKVGLPFYS